MPPQQPMQPEPHHMHAMPGGMWFVAAFVVVLLVGIFLGVELAHSNSDYVCSQPVTNTQQGACTNGSWSDWTMVNGVEQRTYTGTQTTASFSGSQAVSCSHPTSGSKGAVTGVTTIQYAACQIVETGSASGSGSGQQQNQNIKVLTSNTVTTAVLSSSVTASSTYTDYQNAVQTALATSSIRAIPSVVRPGDTTILYWSSDKMKSCVVAGNGDSWQGLTSPDNGQVSSPINQQTTYTLTCTTPSNTQVVGQALVNILPTYQEQ